MTDRKELIERIRCHERNLNNGFPMTCEIGLDLQEAAGALEAEQSFQSRVAPWMQACFGEEISADVAERNHRFLEEALELVQANGCTASESHQLVDYVFGRAVGDPHQEVGGVMVTLAALCLASDLDMHLAGEDELARIWTKVESIRAKQASKPKNSPLLQHVEAELCAAVKPLEWRHVPEELQGYTWRAKKPFGSSYYIHEKDGLYSWGGKYVSLEVAKADAQADYERRILSALTVRPAAEVAAEVKAEAIEAAKTEASEVLAIWEAVKAIDALHTPATRAALKDSN